MLVLFRNTVDDSTGVEEVLLAVVNVIADLASGVASREHSVNRVEIADMRNAEQFVFSDEGILADDYRIGFAAAEGAKRAHNFRFIFRDVVVGDDGSR